jgi:glycosyltransferase involved in cell wall biosynthesis
MPVFRSEQYIRDAIESVLNQSFRDFELIVFDDASPDRTYEIASQIRDSRLRVYRNETNIGPEANWNRALAAAAGRFIKLLPGDDVLYAQCLARQVSILQSDDHHDVVLVYCARDIIDSAGKRVMKARYPGNGVISGARLVRRTVRYGTNIIGEPGAVLFRADAARLIGHFDASLGYVIDLDYWVKLLLLGNAYTIPEALCAFRISGDNWSVELGHQRCNQYLRFLEKLSRHGVSHLDLAIGKLMARVNERLRRVVYRSLLGVRTDGSGRIK